MSSTNSTNVLQESPANAGHPTFTTHVPNPPPLPRPSNSRSQITPLHVNSSERNLQLPAAVAWEAGPEIHSVEPHQYQGHASNALATSESANEHAHPSRASWPAAVSDVAPVLSTGFERAQDLNSQWSLTQPLTEQEQFSRQTEYKYSASSSANVQSMRRPSTKRKAAKVPSSFVERQEKLKVSKRKGPLADKQREKTHTMRKTKRICVRCRFYKSGVRTVCEM